MISVKDGRGQNKKRDAIINFKKVHAYFIKYPDSTISDCCDSTGLTYKTVKKHINSILKEK